jgi:acyl-CoA thioester hydrolase
MRLTADYETKVLAMTLLTPRNGQKGTLRTYSGVVYPAQTDAMGHMTVQYFAAAFDQAMWHLVHGLGYRPEWQAVRGEGWADIRHELAFMKEIRVGGLFWVESSVVAIGTTSLSTRHWLFDSDGELSSTDEIKSVYFDLHERRSRPLPDVIRKSAWDCLNSKSA